MIEKRRRDKINTSLCELRRLVPAAYEKQGSAKLEKAEILQLTVDYLKMLHAKGIIDCRPSPQPITTLTQQHQVQHKQEQLEVGSPIQAHIPSLSPTQHLQTAQQQPQPQSQAPSQQQHNHQQEQLFAGHHHHAAHHQQNHLNHSHLSNAHNYHHQLAGHTSEHLAAAAAAASYHNPVQYYYNL